MGTIKGRNGMKLKEAEEIKKSWQEYTEQQYKKDLFRLDNYDGVINHLKSDIQEWWSKVSLRKYHYEQS